MALDTVTKWDIKRGPDQCERREGSGGNDHRGLIVIAWINDEALVVTTTAIREIQI